MFLGRFPAYILPLVGSLSGILSIVLCYYIAIYLGHEQPLPHTYISNTARHYPQFVIFRIGTVSGALLIILAYFVNYFWLLSVSKQVAYNVHKFIPKIPLVTGIAGILNLFMSTATIDTGKMNMTLHQHCAGLFFILTIFTCFYHTVICYFLYKRTLKQKKDKKSAQISQKSILLKIIISIALIYQIYLSAEYGVGNLMSVESDLGHWLEYTFAFSLLAYILTFVIDFWKFKLGYVTVNSSLSL